VGADWPIRREENLVPQIRTHLSFANVISVIALFVALGGASYAAVSLPKNSVGSKQIKKRAVRAKHINRNAVTASKIQGNAISSPKIADGTVFSVDLADNSIGSIDLADNSVGAGELADNSVGSGEIGNNAVGSSEVADGSITESDLAPDVLGPTAFARIDPTGTLIGGTGQNKGVVQSNVQHSAGASAAEVAGTGVYCFGGLGFTPRSAVVSTDNTDAMPGAPTTTGGSLNFIASVAIFKGEDLGYCDNAHGQVRVAMEQVNDAAAPTLANHGFMIQLQG
jgi:hypothetical protein